jgi:hypothetical protein
VIVVPKESIAFVLFMGLAFGLFWGCLSLALWSANEYTPGLVIAPLWLTAQIGARLSIDPYVAGAMACAAIGVIPAAILLGVARARGA